MPVATSLPEQSFETWRAVEMPPDRFNPYDVELPGVDTIAYEGVVKLGREVVEWTFETRKDQMHNPDRILPFFSGFGGIKLSSKPFGNAAAQLGLGNITVEQIRHDGTSVWEQFSDPHAVQLEAMDLALEGLKYETGIHLSEEDGGTKAVTLGHSMGGELAVRFAETHTSETELVILLATIGFGSPSPCSILRKLIKPRNVINAIREEFVPFIQRPDVPSDLSTVLKALGYFMVNPVRTAGEIRSCLTSDMRERSRVLRDEHGIDTIYGQPVFDLLVQGSEEARDYVSVVGEIERAGHMFVQAKPNRAAYWVQSALNSSPLPQLNLI